jgi:branched-chain amino acid transport system permease protein
MLRRIAVAVFLVAVAAVPLVVHNQYYLNIFIEVMINAVLAMSFLVVLNTGLINVSMAAFWGIGAYSTALLETKAGLSFWAALPISVVMGAVLALIIGLFVVRFVGFGFVILTLVIASIVPLVFGTFSFFGQYVGIINIPVPSPIPLPGGHQIEFTSYEPYYYLLFVLVLIVVVVLWAFYSAWTGRAWKALGLSSQLAQSVAINPRKYRLFAWIIGSTAAVLVGSFYAAYSTALTPDTFGPFKSIYAQFYAILGGTGFLLLGPVVGALVLTAIPEMLRFTHGNEPIITGAIVILLIIFLPAGIVGSISAGIAWFRRRRRAAVGESGPQLEEQPPPEELAKAPPPVSAVGVEESQ